MKIIIIEDDELLAQALQFGLEKEDHEVTYFTNGLTGHAHLKENPKQYGLLVLDWLLPEKSGIAICEEIRQAKINLPILMLTGKEAVTDKVQALNAGADDYLTKPFALTELLARVRALLRRPKTVLPNRLKLADLVLDVETKKIYRGKQEIALTLKEFAILEYLMRHPDQVLTREQILDHVWDYNFDSFSNIVDVHINNLRKKINRHNHGKPPILETVRGIGYLVKTP